MDCTDAGFNVTGINLWLDAKQNCMDLGEDLLGCDNLCSKMR